MNNMSQVSNREEKLFQAIRKGDVQRLQKLLRKGCNPNCRMGDNLCTPASTLAVHSNKLKCLECLLAYDATVVNALDARSTTPALHAAHYGYLSFLEVLNLHHANFNAVDREGRNALMLAAEWGKLDCLNFLINESTDKTDINLRDRQGRTAIMAAAIHGRHECLQYLVDSKAKIDLVDHQDGYSALMYALKHRSYMCATILLDSRANVNIVARDGKTTVLTLALNDSKDGGEYSFVEKLLQLGADVTLSHLDQFYLHEMIARDKKTIVRLMLMNGCPPFDRKCWEPLFHFSHHHMPISPLAVALLSGFYDTAKYLAINQFLTSYDMTILPNDTEIRQKVKALHGEEDETITVLDYFCTGPQSLRVLSFVVLSETFGKCTIDAHRKSLRRELIKNAGLPPPLQNELQFRTSAAKVCVLSWHDLSFETCQNIEVCNCSFCGHENGFRLTKTAEP